MESFDRFQLAGLALICLKNDIRPTPRVTSLISAAGLDVAGQARRERLLHHLESADKRTRWNWQGIASSEQERIRAMA